MENKQFKNQQFDKVSLGNSKKLMWKHIKSQTLEKEQPVSVWAKFLNLLKMPKFALTSGVAVLTVLALFFTTNFLGIFGGRLDNIASADFTIIALDEDQFGVSKDSQFLIEASEDLDVDFIEENLVITPFVEFDLEKAEAAKYTLTPLEELEENSIYRFDIGRESFAFQIKEEAKVMSTIPGNQALRVPVNTGIEIKFSLDDFDLEQAKSHFEIGPNVDGAFKKLDSSLVFVPKKLEPNTIYTVNFSKGLEFGSGETKLEMQEDLEIKFETDEIERKSSLGRIYNNVIISATDEQIKFNGYSDGQNRSVDLYKVSEDQYTKLIGSETTNYWATNTALRDYSLDDVSLVGNYEVDFGDKGGPYVVQHPKLDDYYYILVWKSGGEEIDRTLVELSDLGVYYKKSQKEMLVWSLDYKANTIAKETELFADGKSVGKSDKNGVIKVNDIESYEDTKLWKITHNRRSTYLNISPSNSDYYGYGFGYTNLETPNVILLDKPTYRKTDTIQFHGQVNKEIDNYIAEVSLTGSYGYGGGKGSNDAVRQIGITQNVELDENGVFNGSLSYEDLPSGSYYLALYVDGELINQEFIEIMSVVKDQYIINIKTDKYKYWSNEYVEIEATAHFYDGTPVPELELYNGLKTNQNGELKTSVLAGSLVKTINHNYSSNSVTVEAVASVGENKTIRDSEYIQVYHTDKQLSYSVEKDTNNNAEITLGVEKFELDDQSDLEPIANQEIYGKITATELIEIEEEYYDDYEKITKTSTRTEREDVVVDNFELTTNNEGEATYNFDYSNYIEGYAGRLKVEFWITGANGALELRNTRYLSTNPPREFSSSNGNIAANKEIWLKSDKQTYSVGDTIELKITHESPYNNEENSTGEVEEVAGDHFLFTKTNKLGEIEYKFTQTPNTKLEFEPEDPSQILVSGISFNAGYLVKTYDQYLQYDINDSTYEVEVNTDKEKYQPGETAELEVKVKTLEGQNAANTNINLTMIDESYLDATYNKYPDIIREVVPFVSIYNRTGASHSIQTATYGDKGGCFLPETLITMANGSVKQIQDIEVGDLISTKESQFSDKKVDGTVVAVQKHLVNEYLVINDKLQVTRVHKMFVNNSWITAGEIKVGDVLENYNGKKTIVQNIETVKKETWVYNFEVEKYHTYFAENFYVHNDKGGSSTRVRENFQDVAAFIAGTTDASGEFKANVELPDNITNWKLIARAFNLKELYAGSSEMDVITSLPLFLTTVLQDSYLQGDKPQVKVRVFGEEVFEHQLLDLTFEGETSKIVSFTDSYYPLDTSEIGARDIEITAANSKHSDGIKKSFEVMPNKLTIAESKLVDVLNAEDLKTIKNVEKVTLVNKAVAEVYGPLKQISYRGGNRLDQNLSRLIAGDLLEKYFGEEAVKGNINDYLASGNGYSLLPYSSSDLELTALALILDHQVRSQKSKLLSYFNSFYDDESLTLDERVFTLVGYAGLNKPVLNDIRKLIENEDLDVKQTAFLGLALLEIGDKTGAKNIYQDLHNKFKTDEEKALGAVLANGTGFSEEAKKIWQKLDLDGVNLNHLNLYKVAFYKHALKQMVPEATIAEVNGEEIVFDTRTKYALLAANLEGLEIDVESGQLAALVEYQKVVENYENHPDIEINRTYSTTNLGERDEVIITLKVSVPNLENTGCIEVVDYLPHGLKPLKDWEQGFRIPYRSEGQKQHFCLWPTNTQLKYRANVVSKGEFQALPATASLRKYPEIRSYSEPEIIVID
jgi:hypothetical protein